MLLTRRQITLALAALPAACAFQPLSPLRGEAAAPPGVIPPLRPAALGQRWTYRKYNGFNSLLLATETDEVTAIEPRVVIRRSSDAANTPVLEEQQQPWGLTQRDLAWDRPQNLEPAWPLWPADPTPGTRHVDRGRYHLDGQSYRYGITRHSQVQGWEYLTLPQGRWLTLRVEHFIRLQHEDPRRLETTRHDTLWLAPEIGRWVAREVSGEYLIARDKGYDRSEEDRFRWELQSWV